MHDSIQSSETLVDHITYQTFIRVRKILGLSRDIVKSEVWACIVWAKLLNDQEL